MDMPISLRARIFLASLLNRGKRVLLDAVIVLAVALAAAGVSPSATAQPQAAPKIVPVSPALLDSYAGFYEFDADTPAHGAVLTVTHEGDHLAAQLSGQGKGDIFPSSPNEFFYNAVKASITFVTGTEGQVTGLVLHQNGLNMHATRSTAAAAAKAGAAIEQKLTEQRQPHTVIAIDPGLLDGYVGRYRLAPNAIFTVTREGDQLFAELTGQPKFQIYPYGPKDFFYTVVAAQLSFVTDAKGRATQVILHQNGRDAPAPRIE